MFENKTSSVCEGFDALLVNGKQVLHVSKVFIVVQSISANEVIGHFKPYVICPIVQLQVLRITLVEGNCAFN